MFMKKGCKNCRQWQSILSNLKIFMTALHPANREDMGKLEKVDEVQC